MQTLSAAQVSPETPINENFETLGHQSVYGKRHPTTSGLTWGYYGGRWGGFAITAGTLTLTNAATNRVVVLRSSGVISTSTATTNWNNTAEYARVYQITTAGSVVTAVEDHRAGPFGVHGPRIAGRRIRSISAAYGFVLDDEDTIVLHPAADTTARTWTIPANSSVVFPIGTGLQIINQNAAGVLTIAITSDTMRLAGAGTTGSRTLAANGSARVTKITATEWIIEGTGLT
jgi:hypothetical protein